MSAPEKDLFGGPNEAACPKCHQIKKCLDDARECARQHAIEERKARLRIYARTGVSQRPKAPENAK